MQVPNQLKVHLYVFLSMQLLISVYHFLASRQECFHQEFEELLPVPDISHECEEDYAACYPVSTWRQ
jgi:hypothetical protein